MKARSAKAKGRRAVEELREALLQAAPDLHPDDIQVKTTSAPGEDLWLSPKARGIYPWVWEVKNVERLNIWEALSQAESHRGEGLNPFPAALAFKRNRSELYIAVRLTDWLREGKTRRL